MRKRIALTLILLVAAALRLYSAITCTAIPDYSDMATYNDAAVSGGIPSFPPPGYPLFLRLVYSVFGTMNYTAVFVVQALLSVLTVFLIYLTARAVTLGEGDPNVASGIESAAGVRRMKYAETTGLVAGAIAAIYPNFIAYNLTTMTESLSLLLVMTMLYIATGPIGDMHRAILSGFTLSLGFFVKPSMLFFAPGLLFGLRKKLVFLLTILAVLSPHIVYRNLTGASEGRAARLLYKAYNPRAEDNPHFTMKETELGAEDVSSETYISETVKYISSNRWETLDIIYGKASVLVSSGWDSYVLKDISRRDKTITNTLIYAYLPVMIFGFIGIFRYCDRRNRIVASTLFSYLIIHIVITIFKIRYRLLVEPLLILYASIAIVGICGFRPGGSPGENTRPAG